MAIYFVGDIGKLQDINAIILRTSFYKSNVFSLYLLPLCINSSFHIGLCHRCKLTWSIKLKLKIMYTH
jgi:hypothetical protein